MKLLQDAEKYKKAHRRKKWWYRVVTCLAAVVVFCTTYALILPAITMEGEVCGLQEHTHSVDCYTQVTSVSVQEPVCTPESLNLHQHTQACYDDNGNLICGYADYVIHTHNANCYTGDGTLWCPLREVGTHVHGESCYWIPEAPEVHVHTEECYAPERGQLICEIPEVAGHIHGADCYLTNSTLICELPESEGHAHGDGCYDENGALICEQEESEGHFHGEGCYETQTDLICEIPEDPGHQHTDECYEWNQVLICELSTEPVEAEEPAEPVLICERPEIILHTHTEACFDESGNLVCGKIQILEHEHTEDCFRTVELDADTETLTCTLAEGEGAHTHGEGCYDEEGNLVCGLEENAGHRHNALCYGTWELTCGLPEHVHTEACLPEKEPETVYFCGKEVHTHDETCYDEAGELTCALEEHVHTEACLREEEPEPVYLCGKEAHTHDETCYDEAGELICALEEHVHTEACLAEEEPEPVYLCGKESHTHNETCYDEAGELVCGLEEHTHSEACQTEPKIVYYCGREAHIHDETCYDEAGELICGLEEHIHDEGCQVEPQIAYFCGKTAHTHDDTCYNEEGELICALEEHIHTDACLSNLTADVETPQEWEQTFADVRLTGEWTVDVIAIARTQLGYRESTQNCIVLDNGEVKGYTRYGDWYGSPYGDWCAMFVSFCLHYAKVEYTPMDWGCRTWIEALEKLDRYCPADGEYVPVSGDLIFFDWGQDGQSDHVGLVADVYPATEEEPARIRTIEGNSSNMVQYVTYDQDDPVILGYGKLPEQTFYCGKTGHSHTDYCGGPDQCVLEEHIHTDSCEEFQAELTYEGPDYTVRVQYGADAELPEGVTLTVSEIPKDSEEYQDYLQQATVAMEAAGQAETVIFARFFDVQFQLEGEKIEPAAAVSVTIIYAEPVETAGDANCQAVHFAENGTELLDVTTERQEDGSTSFTHTQEGFSVVGNVVSVAADYNSTDVGPNSLPVDYYVCIDGEWTYVGSTKTGWYNNWNGTEGWNDFNRDYITVVQAVSILGKYGLTGEEENPSLVTAYQQKSGDNLNVYSDTNTVAVGDQKILPLSRNADHAGYNLYYLPSNGAQINGVTSPDNLDKTANGFYTVKVFDDQGKLVTSEIIKTGGSFTYDATATGETSWLIVDGNGSTTIIKGSEIKIENITSPIIISPNHGGETGSHSVTFKVMIDGEWKTVGSLPYYYSGSVNGSERAYITSTMAAQFLGDYGYTASTDPGYHFGYSYNDIYTLFYASGSTQTNFCMDIAGGTLQEAQVVQLYTSNGTDAQVFRVWDAGNGYSFITPIGNSNYHVNVYGYSTGDPSSTQLKLSSAVNANSQWKVDTGSDGKTTFWSALAPDDQVIDLNNNQIVDGGRLQVWHSTGGARYWYMVQQYRISNDTVSAQNTEGTYNIGLTPESNGDIVCYYMPAETGSAYTNVSESAVSTANSFWSVSVRDDTHSVYSDGELSNMVQIVKPGAEATVTVRNAEGILWSCRGMNGTAVEVETSQSGGDTTFLIKNITQPIEVMATKADPSFTVQYFANIPRFAESGENPLKVIDTSGGVLPTNGGSIATKNLYLEGIGRNTSQNAGDATELFTVKTTIELTKLYTEKLCQYESEPGLEYFNKLKNNEDYVLKEIWTLKEGQSEDSINPEDWEVYTYNTETAFTNEAGQAGENTILITDSAVVRLVFDTSAGNYYNGTTFYDYDISSGKNADGSWNTIATGINSAGNYSGVGAHFAFGNQNCGTGMQSEAFSGNTLNMANSTNSNYGKSTFGLVTRLDGNGNIVYNSAVVAPKLFNEGDAIGKQTYAGSSLTFDRVGDTYTLSAATLRNSNGQSHTINELQYFFHPSPAPGKIWDGVNSGYTWQNNIFTNNFWPLDPAVGRTDGMWGKYGSYEYFNEVKTNHELPIGDDGNAHNWFFGMNFALSFNLTEDYEGPLEYYFFGDDDLWVFLDGQLVCDIGGVHSSIGEYVNLRDYLPVGSSGQHTLSFFYTERGASGSTCYMSFTLPSVSSATTSRDTGSLQIEKKLEQTGGADFSGVEYKFMVELLTAENGSALNQTFSYSRSDGTYGTIKSGGTITLCQNESITISGIPAGTFYRVTELSTEGYQTTVNGNEGYIVSGKIETGAIKPAYFVNRPYHELPSTGGGGTILYTFGGIAIMAFVLMYILRKRKGDMFS